MWTDKHRGQATLARRNEALRLSDALRDYKAKNPKASLREVASVFGVSHMTVKRAQKMRKFEAGKKANVESVKVRAKGKAQMVEQIRAIKVDNPSLSTREIAKIVDRSHMTVARALACEDAREITLEEHARELDVSRSTLNRAIAWDKAREKHKHLVDADQQEAVLSALDKRHNILMRDMARLSKADGAAKSQ